ncbi:MAG: glycosyltransferase, partial [Candidatus Delongbacteria bacterium]|nr:glycosyltransferase [Candidatus Delongbacteria bacterium]
MNILYFTFWGLEKDSGYTLQFMSEVRHLLTTGHQVTVLTGFNLFKSGALRDRIKKVKQEVEEQGGRFEYFNVFGGRFSFVLSFINCWVAWRIRRLILRDEIQILQAHADSAAHIAARVRAQWNGVFIYDMHGTTLAERKEILGEDWAGTAEYARMRSQKQKALQAADRVFCVSEVFREYLINEYQLSGANITVTRSGTDINPLISLDEISRLREELSLTDKTVLVYAGGVSQWQKIETTLHLFELVQAEAPGAIFLFLIPAYAAQEFSRMLGDTNLPDANLRVLNLPPSQVHSYLSLADFGILLRDRNMVNRVASPIKLAEYLMAGLNVVVSDEIGDTTQ